MAGFGFLSDMNKSLKLNRDNLKSSQRPFDKDRLSERWTTENVRLKDASPMSESERDRFLQRLRDEKRKQSLMRVLVLLTLGVAALVVVFIMIRR